jgi:hypothetical protein
LTQRPGGTQATRSPRAAGDAWDNPRRIGYPQIQEVAPHPEGGPTLFVVREPLLTAERSEFLSHLYLSPDDPGAAPLQLTFGEHRNFTSCSRAG